MSEKQPANGNEFILEVQSDETNAAKGSSSAPPELSTEPTSTTGTSKPIPPDISRAGLNPGTPPRIPNRNESLNRRKSFTRGSPKREEIYRKVRVKKLAKHGRPRMKCKFIIKCIVFLCILGISVTSFTVEKVGNYMIWGLKIWKWCVLVLVIFGGKLITDWLMFFVLFMVKSNFLLKKKVLYYVHGMERSIRVLMWFALVLVTWQLLLNRGTERSKHSAKIWDYVTWTLVSILVGAFLWSLETFLFKFFANKFEVHAYFDRTQDSLFHQYVLQTLSGPEIDGMTWGKSPRTSKLDFRASKKAKAGKEKEVFFSLDKEKEFIDVTKLLMINKNKVSAWNLKLLVDAVTNSGLSTICQSLDEMEGQNERVDKEITSEMEAIDAAYDIFLNVAPLGALYIEECDLMRFMIEEEVELVWPLIDVAKTGLVDRKTLTEWVIKCYHARRAIAHTVTDTKKVLKQLDQFFISIVIVITMIVWLLLLQIATLNIVVLISSQLVLAAFMFGNTCKNVFEAIVFIFVTHPFDVGDRIVVEDGAPLMVEEINVLTTILVKLNNEKVYYPNSVLSTKSISNIYRSPDMGDTVEFSILLTPAVRINMLRDQVKEYLECNPHYWYPNHNLVLIDIEDVNKLKMALHVTHTMNFQEFGERNKRRTELIMKVMQILERLHITYFLLPQEVRN